jgi:beta-glucanase (GH16 family)
MRLSSPALLYLSSLLSLATAFDAPQYNGFRQVWSDSFGGSAGQFPDEGKWNIVDGYFNPNDDHQTYFRNNKYVQLSGGQTLQLVPWRDGSQPRGWGSGRIESKYVFTPEAGRRTMVEAQIRFGGNPTDQKQGIWPAFWLLGDSMRHGTNWPACGELDILETVNGQLRGYGTAHCDVYPNGICNEPAGRAGNIGVPTQDWQNWRIVWDRTNGDWRNEQITWYMNGQQFHSLRGNDIGNQGVWASLAQKPMYIILNVAVGGNWVCSEPLSPENYSTNNISSPAPRTAAPATDTAR